MSTPRVGIIGGYGPLTSAVFCRKLVEHAQQRDTEHAPSFAMESMPISMSDAALCIAGDIGATRRLVVLANEGMRRLGALGVRWLAFPCNSVHTLADEFAVPAGVRLLHIADVTAQRLATTGVSTVGFLASGMTVKAGFYQERFAAAGIAVVQPAAPLQETLNSAIARYVRSGVMTDDDREACEAAVHSVTAQGAETIALCCTDISGMLEAAHMRIALPVVDSMEVLAQECAKHSVLGGV